MAPDLSDRERERFEELRNQLEGVSQAEPGPTGVEASPGPIDPMLATSFEGDLTSLEETDWIAEQKYDGTRIILEKFVGEVSLYTRRHVERSDTLDELTTIATGILPDGLILDGEYTYLRPDGSSRFLPIHTAGDKVDEEELTPRFFVFDILARDHEWCTREPLLERKDRLVEIVPNDGLLEVVEYETTEFQAYFDDFVHRGEECIIIKRRESAYHRGTRSDHWKKVRAFEETDLIVVGYTSGEGSRADTFGALVLTDGEQYVGRVGSGFSEAELDELHEAMSAVTDRPVPFNQVGSVYTPVEPFVVQVKYQEVTESTELRAPVFLRRRPDKPIDDVEPISPRNS